MTKASAKPTDPQEAARQRHERIAERQNLADQRQSLSGRLALPSNATIVHGEGEPERGRYRPPQRHDCFHLLHARNAFAEGSLTCVRRLEREFAIRAGVRDADLQERVDRGPSTRGQEDAMVAAAWRIEAVLTVAGPVARKLLTELIEPRQVHAETPDRWRVVVRLLTGEKNEKAQAALVRNAAANLMLAYQVIDQQPRRAA